MRRRFALLVFAVVTTCCAAAGGCSFGEPSLGERLGEARQSAQPLYWLGDSFQGFPLEAGGLRPDGKGGASGGFFYYGSCEPPRGEGGCAPPIEIQIFPLCERRVELTRLGPGKGPLPHEDLVLRGAPVTRYEQDGHLEIYAGSVTIVIWTDRDSPLQGQTAQALRSFNAAAENVGPGERFPAPRFAACDQRQAPAA